MPATSRDFDAVVFDIGGVILDLSGLRSFLDRHRLDYADFMRRALGSGAHQRYEQGAMTTDEYVTDFLAEADLAIDRDEFVADFATWPGDFFPGAAELVAAVRVMTASLSNTNPVHWEAPKYADVVLPLFDRHFPSYQLGLAKPDPAIFERVVADLGVAADRVVFLDDNGVNAEVARSCGIEAHQVDGPAAARQVLERLELVVAL